jgi:AcrR family transcriptional regulator
MNEIASLCVRGRPREFCTDAALAAALRVFWSKGYDGASMTDLTEAMGITRPSLYAAFGNKESLFVQALDLYEREKLAYVGRALAEPTIRGVAEVLLRGAVDNVCSAEEPNGCLGFIASVSCGDDSQAIREEVVKRGKASKAALLERLERAHAEGDLPPNISSDGLTSLISAMLQGISVQAGSGATREELDRMVDTGLAMWPTV